MICVQDWDRMHVAFRDLQAYWNMLDRKRKQLEKELNGQIEVDVAQRTLLQSMRHIQLDLRDLMSQVSTQVHYVFILKAAHVYVAAPAYTEFEGSDTSCGLINFVLLSSSR